MSQPPLILSVIGGAVGNDQDALLAHISAKRACALGQHRTDFRRLRQSLRGEG